MAGGHGRAEGAPREAEEASSRILTVPNVISAVRLCLVPVFLVLLLGGHDIPATVLFALAAGTDWIDGQIARRTHAVSKLGQLLDLLEEDEDLQNFWHNLENEEDLDR